MPKLSSEIVTNSSLRFINGLHIKSAVESAGKKVVEQIQNKMEPLIDVEIIDLDLVDVSGNVLNCELGIFFKRKITSDGETKMREVLIVLAPRGILNLNKAAYFKNLEVVQLGNEIAFRSWKILAKKDQSEVVFVTSNMATNSQYRNIGIGQALLQFGEFFKDQIAHVVANRVGVTQICSIIEDGSADNWTTKQISMLEDYSPMANSDSEHQRFEKNISVSS